MKYLAITLFAILSQLAFAQGAPPPPGHGPGGVDPCNMIFDGEYMRAGGPLTISFDRIQNSRDVNVTLVYRGRHYHGYGQCSDREFAFNLDNGWPHSGRFLWDRFGYVRQIKGTQWVDDRPYQKFTLTPRD